MTFWLRVLYTGGGPGALPRWLVFELQSPTLCRRGKAIFGPPRKPRVQTLSSQEPLGIPEEVTSSHPPLAVLSTAITCRGSLWIRQAATHSANPVDQAWSTAGKVPALVELTL